MRTMMSVEVLSLEVVIALLPTGPPQRAVEEPENIRAHACNTTFADRNDSNGAE